MKIKTAVVEIDEQGNSSVNLEGFHGKGCADVAKAFQGGDAVKNVRNKSEYYIPETTGNSHQQHS